MEEVRDILERTRTIAVLGASATPSRAGFYVGEYLQHAGYEVWPINPARVGQQIWGRPVYASLADLPSPVDLIDVFRRPEQLPAHVDQILALSWKPDVVWFQLGIQHAPSAARLRASGIAVVENRCTLADHRRLLG